jgi:hypothetical protein
VNTSVFNVLTDSVDKKLSLRGDGIDINLEGTLDELGDDNGVIGRDTRGGEKLVLELRLGPDDSHGSAGKDVRRADKDGVFDGVSEFLRVLIRSKLLPGRLVNTDRVENRGELVPVLSLVNVERVGTKNLGLASLLELESDVLGQLTADRDNDTRGVLKLVDIHDTLVAKLFEVKAVGEIVIGRGGFL